MSIESRPEARLMQTLTMIINRDSNGRYQAPWRSMSDLVSFRYLVKLSGKYEIGATTLLQCLYKAWTTGEASYKGLGIKRRQVLDNSAVFQVRQGKKIAGQFKLTKPILDYIANPDLSNLGFDEYELSRTRPPPKKLKIRDLNPETKSRFSVTAKVIEKSPPRMVSSKWGTSSLLSTATIADGTGTIKLPLWRERINIVSVGDSLHIENARLRRYRDELQIRVDRFAKLWVEN